MSELEMPISMLLYETSGKAAAYILLHTIFHWVDPPLFLRPFHWELAPGDVVGRDVVICYKRQLVSQITLGEIRFLPG